MHEQLISCSPVLRRLENEGDQPELDDILESAVEAHKALHVEGALALRRLESALEKRKLRRRGALRPTAGSHPRHDLA
jgi:hypothetical protein